MLSVFRRLATLAWGALGVFHLWLLAGQAWNGGVGSGELTRWAVALGLAGALVALRRRGGSLLGDRRITAIWALVALLHGPALAERAELSAQALAETPVVVVQAVCAAAGLGLALALTTRDGHMPLLRGGRIVPYWPLASRISDASVGFRFLPRPPPAG
jgi:hypothetical protein